MKIRWTIPADEDLDSIFQHISRDSEYYASNFIEEIFNVTRIFF